MKTIYAIRFLQNQCNNSFYLKGFGLFSVILFMTQLMPLHAQSWSAVGNNAYYVTSIMEHNEELYCINSNVQTWNGTLWENVGTGQPGNVLTVLNNKLYSNYASWDGATWTEHIAGINCYNGVAYHDTLFWGGGFNKYGSIYTDKIIGWTGESIVYFDPVDVNSGYGTVAMGLYKDALYAARQTSNSSSAPNVIVKFKDGVWSKVGSAAVTDMKIYSMVEFNNALYIGGKFTSVDGKPAAGVAKWDGTQWSDAGISSIDNTVRALAVYNGELYAAGYFNTVNGNPMVGIMKYNGTSWSDVGGGLSASPWAECLYAGKNGLYVGGSFSTAGGVPVVGIALWSESSGTSIASVEKNDFFHVYPTLVENSLSFSLSAPTSVALAIYDINGRLVYQKKETSYTVGSYAVDINSLDQGVYLIKAITAQGEFVHKMVKQ